MSAKKVKELYETKYRNAVVPTIKPWTPELEEKLERLESGEINSFQESGIYGRAVQANEDYIAIRLQNVSEETRNNAMLQLYTKLDAAARNSLIQALQGVPPDTDDEEEEEEKKSDEDSNEDEASGADSSEDEEDEASVADSSEDDDEEESDKDSNEDEEESDEGEPNSEGVEEEEDENDSKSTTSDEDSVREQDDRVEEEKDSGAVQTQQRKRYGLRNRPKKRAHFDS